MSLFATYEYTIRQRLSRMLDDCVLATVSAGAVTTATLATTNPPQFYSKANDYFNKAEYEVYCYSGTNTGVSRLASDWDTTSKILTVTPAAGSAYDTTSLLEFHRIFPVLELRDAVIQTIELYAGRYLVDLDDDTTVILAETTSNDGQTLYTYEYALPTNILYISRVTTEDSVAGYKLTGPVSGAFTLGEVVKNAGTTATGILSYGPGTVAYILAREVSGTFAVGDTVTGETSGQTCGALTAVESETVGDGRFPLENVVDPRDYTILKEYSPKIKFDENQYDIVDDLRIRIEGQGSQEIISADTDYIFLPPNDLVEVAATFLPFSKIESSNLTATFNKCMITREKVESQHITPAYAHAKKVIE